MKKKIGCIDILAILGLAGILAAMFLPAINPAGPTAYRMWCMNNMKQIGLALRMYSNNNRKRYQKHEFYPDESGDKGLKKLLIGYLENKEIYKCPKDKRVKKTFWEKTFGSSPKPEELKFKSDYIYLGGFHEDEAPVIPILFDKIGNHKNHCNVIFSDGQPEYYKLEYGIYDDLLEMINQKKNYSKETMERIKESLKKALKNNKADNEENSE